MVFQMRVNAFQSIVESTAVHPHSRVKHVFYQQIEHLCGHPHSRGGS